jgi:hypothetical protein
MDEGEHMDILGLVDSVFPHRGQSSGRIDFRTSYVTPKGKVGTEEGRE